LQAPETIEIVVTIAISMVGLILSLSFHEAAHAWTANKLGDPTARMLGRLTLNPLAHIDWIGTVLFPIIAMLSGFPLIGWAKPVPVSMSNLKAPRRDFAVVAVAGPISNLILAVAGVLLLAAVLRAGMQTGELAVTFIYRFIRLNVFLAVFNMIPLPPLDGGNVLAGLVPGPVAVLIDRIRPYGFLILYGLLLTNQLDRLWPLGLAVESFLLRLVL
jgi:Zn-dependent protease